MICACVCVCRRQIQITYNEVEIISNEIQIIFKQVCDDKRCIIKIQSMRLRFIYSIICPSKRVRLAPRKNHDLSCDAQAQCVSGKSKIPSLKSAATKGASIRIIARHHTNVTAFSKYDLALRVHHTIVPDNLCRVTPHSVSI